MSESIAKLLQGTERALDDFERADETTRRVEALIRAERDIAPHIEDLERVVTAFDVLAQFGRGGIRPDASALTRILRETAALVRVEKALPLEYSKALREIRWVVDAARVTAKEEWHESIEERMPGLDGLAPLANLMSRLVENPVEIDRLRRATAVLKTLSKNLPNETTSVEVAENVAIIEQALMALLGSSNETGDVRNFIELAARGGAPVSALTPAVTDWMQRNNTAGSFRIVSGRPASE